MTLHLEFTIEPFHDALPGPYVIAARQAAEESGLEVEFGPFGTSLDGPDEKIISTMAQIAARAMDEGASSISLRLDRL